MDDKPILNLDEVLGARTLKVRYKGKEYPIRPVEALSPEEFGKMMAYGTKFQEMSAAQVEQNGLLILKAIDDMLEIIGPSLPRYKPAFLERVKTFFKKKTYLRKFALSVQESQAVMQFWTENNRKNAAGAGEPIRKPRTRR
mgnify:CR=1 FL=1